jgi:6-pyruvoyltetrahydropterin/6-carboxytetrahydropterin synthase
MQLAAITKHLSFDCAHFLLNPKWSREENMAKFHKCCLYKDDGTEEPHGHTYHMEITVFGMVDPETGFVIDFKELKRILKEGVVERLDHRLINNIPYLKDYNRLATVENILQYIWKEIAPSIDALRPKLARLQKIKIWETPDSFAELTDKDIAWQEHVAQEHRCSCGQNGACEHCTKKD